VVESGNDPVFPEREVHQLIERAIPFREFYSLSQLPNVRLISLQKDYGLLQLVSLPPDMRVESFGDTLDAGPDAFVDTAALMEHLDIVITCDTSIAHIAGALARPTWVALKYVPDWRWMLHRSDSPWYPTMRLFRQIRPDDWASVFCVITAELKKFLAIREETGVVGQFRLGPAV